MNALTEKTCLVVDDDRMNLYIVENLLQKYRIQIDTASNGIEAKALCELIDYDVIITDYEIPYLNGIELAKWVNKNKKAKLIVAMTSCTNTEVHARLHQAGVAKVIDKPLTFEAIRNALTEILSPLQ